MPNLVARAIRTAARTLASTAGAVVLYRRGLDSAKVTAVVGQTTFERHDVSGLVALVQTRDYLFDASELGRLDPPEPRVGDRIEDAGHVYEIMPPSADSQAWRYRDGSRTQVRVHTKRVGGA